MPRKRKRRDSVASDPRPDGEELFPIFGAAGSGACYVSLIGFKPSATSSSLDVAEIARKLEPCSFRPSTGEIQTLASEGRPPKHEQLAPNAVYHVKRIPSNRNYAVLVANDDDESFSLTPLAGLVDVVPSFDAIDFKDFKAAEHKAKLRASKGQTNKSRRKTSSVQQIVRKRETDVDRQPSYFRYLDAREDDPTFNLRIESSVQSVVPEPPSCRRSVRVSTRSEEKEWLELYHQKLFPETLHEDSYSYSSSPRRRRLDAAPESDRVRQALQTHFVLSPENLRRIAEIPPESNIHELAAPHSLFVRGAFALKPSLIPFGDSSVTIKVAKDDSSEDVMVFQNVPELSAPVGLLPENLASRRPVLFKRFLASYVLGMFSKKFKVSKKDVESKILVDSVGLIREVLDVYGKVSESSVRGNAAASTMEWSFKSHSKVKTEPEVAGILKTLKLRASDALPMTGRASRSRSQVDAKQASIDMQTRVLEMPDGTRETVRSACEKLTRPSGKNNSSRLTKGEASAVLRLVYDRKGLSKKKAAELVSELKRLYEQDTEPVELVMNTLEEEG